MPFSLCLGDALRAVLECSALNQASPVFTLRVPVTIAAGLWPADKDVMGELP
jgi:hypothetical protein